MQIEHNTIANTLPDPVKLDDVIAQAQKAAWIEDDAQAACPYEAGSLAAEVFRHAFDHARTAMTMGAACPGGD